jgi:hypothetical protein
MSASLSPLPFGADLEASEIQRIIDCGLAEDVGSGDVRIFSGTVFRNRHAFLTHHVQFHNGSSTVPLSIP